MIAKKAAGGPQTGKGYPTAASAGAAVFERLLNTIKGVFLAGAGGGFSRFEGGTDYA
jgi:hypothetical protein